MNFRKKKLFYNLMTIPAIAYNSRRAVVSKVCLKLTTLLFTPLLAYRNLLLLCSFFVFMLWAFSHTVLHKFLPNDTDNNSYPDLYLNNRLGIPRIRGVADLTDPTRDLRAYRDRKLGERRAIPIIFVGGMPRSGTTLMRAILDAHPEVRCGEETRVIPRLLFMRKNWSASKIEAKRLAEARITESVLDSAIGEFILAILTERNLDEPTLDRPDYGIRPGGENGIQPGDGPEGEVGYKDERLIPKPDNDNHHLQIDGEDHSDDSVVLDDFNSNYDPQRRNLLLQQRQQYDALQKRDRWQPKPAQAQAQAKKNLDPTGLEPSKIKSVRLCNKDPFVMKTADVVGRIFPRAKFVFMIRDGRAVVQSVVSRKVTITGWNVQDHKQSLAMWNQGIEQMYDICQTLGPSRCLPVHYETLVLKPRSTISEILQFLDLPWNPMVMRHSEMVGKPDGISLSKLERSSDQVIKPINTQALYSWVQGFPAELFLKAFEIAPMLEKLNYSLDGVPYYGEPDPLVKQNDKWIQDNRDFYEEKQKYFQRLPGT